MGEWERVEMNTFEKNMASFEKRVGCAANEIREIDIKKIADRAGCDCNSDGIDVLYKIYHNRKWRLNSGWNPQFAAEMYASRYKIQLYGIYFVFGFSDGRYIREFAKKCDDTNLLIVCVPDKELFAVACHYFDLRDILEDKKIVIYFPEDGQNEEQLVHQFVDYTQIKLLEFCILPGHDILYHEECEKFMDGVLECMRHAIVNKETHLAFNRLLPQHMLYHMKHLINHSNIEQLKQALATVGNLDEIPVIIVSAGPSLDKNIHLLKQAQGKAFIIAVDASIRTVIKSGVKPNLLCSVDPNSPERFFSELDITDICWAVNNWSNTRLLEKYQPTHCFYYGWYGQIWTDLLQEVLGYEFPNIVPGGSVSTEAFMLALYLGFRKIVLIGQDLAFTGGVSHTKGIEDALGDNDEYIKSRQIVEVEGIDGTMLQTDYQMWFYKQWFEKVIRFYKDAVQVIDATEGGAKIEGAEIRTLKDVIETECKRDFDIYEMEQSISPMFSEEQQAVMFEKLKKMRNLILKFEENVKDAILKQEEAAKELGKPDVSAEKQQKLLYNLINSNQIIEKDPLLSYISMYAQNEEYEMGDTIYAEENLTPEQLVEKSLTLLKGYQNGEKLFLEDFDEFIMKD
ncbi:MAG: DUF115 domain-containing protein [Roseburia intestinalis]|nr:DUF115 domain-containing protein [Roseburia intestinalis]